MARRLRVVGFFLMIVVFCFVVFLSCFCFVFLGGIFFKWREGGRVRVESFYFFQRKSNTVFAFLLLYNLDLSETDR